jgi:hypothetical protein
MNTLLRSGLCALLFLGSLAHAHTSGNSFVMLDEQADGTLAAELDFDLRDLNLLVQLDQSLDGAITWGEVLHAGDRIEAEVLQRVRVSAGAQACAVVARAPLSIAEHGDGPYVRLSLRYSCAPGASGLSFDYSGWFAFDAGHRALLEYRASDDTTVQAILTQTNPSWHATESIGTRLRRFLGEGVRHLLTGYDHLAFLGVLLLALARRKRPQEPVALADMLQGALAVITAFTLAHSLTLALAAMGHLSLPIRPVEVVIAASVLLAALLNLRRSSRVHGWKLAFGFGLVHGLGFAGALTELASERLDWLALAAFNVGIELAQIGIAVVAVPVMWCLFRDARSERVGVPLVSACCALLAASWTVTRLFA